MYILAGAYRDIMEGTEYRGNPGENFYIPVPADCPEGYKVEVNIYWNWDSEDPEVPVNAELKEFDGGYYFEIPTPPNQQADPFVEVNLVEE